MKTCYKTEIAGFPITLEQRDSGKFRVTYGLRVADNLNYASAAKELGECMLHALACEGVLDNQIEQHNGSSIWERN